MKTWLELLAGLTVLLGAAVILQKPQLMPDRWLKAQSNRT